MQISVEKMFLYPRSIQPCAGRKYNRSIYECADPQGIGRTKTKPGDTEAKPAGQRRQGQGEHEAIVEAIRQKEKYCRGHQQVAVPGALQQLKAEFDVAHLDGEGQTEIGR